MAGDLDIPSPTPINHPRKDDLPKRIQRHHICISKNWEYGDPRLDVDQATATQINEAIAYTMQFYDESEYQDKTLWQYFKDDFGHWTESTFQKGNTNLVRGFRDFLREKGVYCTKDGGAVAASLMRVIRETTQSAWPLDEEDIKQKHHSICDTSQDTELASTPRDLSRIHNNEDIINKRITDLNKMYTDDEKYSGKLYDFFQSKLMLFKDKCQRISMPEEGLTRALPTMLKGNAMAYYLDNLAGNDLPYVTMVTMIQRRFETDNTTQLYWDELRRTTLQTTMAKNPSKSMMEALEDLIQTIQQTYRGIRGPIVDDREMQNTLLSAVTGVPECGRAIYDGASTFEDLASKIRKSVRIAEDDKKTMTQYHSTAHFVDRQFYNNNSRHNRPKSTVNRNQRSKPICYVCRKEGCWSSKHSNKEQQQAKDDWFSSRRHRTPPTDKKWQTFITFCEGDSKDNSGDDNSRRDSLSELIDESEALVTDYIEDVTATSQHFTSDLTSTTFFTKTSTPNATDILGTLQDQAFRHAFLKDDPYDDNKRPDNDTFICEDRYSNETFRGILPDTGASGVSSAGFPQVQALQRLQPSLKVDKAEGHEIKFGKGSETTIGVIRLPTILGTINFHVLLTSTPFLFSITDMDRLGVYLHNLENLLIQGEIKIPVIRRWGHPWWIIDAVTTTAFHLTETQLRQLHRRFGHPSVNRLTKMLQRADQEFDSKALRRLTQLCRHCQINGKAPSRFRFTLRDDHEFNYEIIVDIVQIDDKPALHIVDSATSFQAARFLDSRGQKAKDIWDTLRACWIDSYLGPPDWIVHDAGRNFASAEFRQYARTMSIEVDEVPVEAHNSIGKVERYHGPLRRAYNIIKDELGDAITDDQKLQMAVKAVNDSAGPDGLVPTLLVFGAYPRLTDDSPPAFTVVQRAEAIRKATSEARKLLAKRQVNDALRTRNGPDTLPTHQLPLQSDVRVWREKGGWQGPHRLLATDGETCTVEMPYGPTKFRTTIVKPFYHDKDDDKTAKPPQDNIPDLDEPDDNPPEVIGDTIVIPPAKERTRRRTRGPRLVDQIFTSSMDDAFIQAIVEGKTIDMAFITAKEEADWQLCLQLRQEGRITTPGRPFELSDQTEIDALQAQDVFRFERYDPLKHGTDRLFKSRLVREIKGKGTTMPYEKSRLVIQGHSDNGKQTILTQSPTIQRASQRLIVALVPSLASRGIFLWIRDITQAYVQSTTKLNRTILARLPDQIRDQFPEGTIMVVVKPLYGIAEAGTHWWATYFNHHRDNLRMTTSTFDPCLLVTTTRDCFGITGMQTDDTLGLGDQRFFDLEEEQLKKAKFTAKPKEILTPDNLLLFNGCKVTQDADGSVTLSQKDQGQKLELIDASLETAQEEYVKQRARGAYIATICQPEASFDLSTAAQHQDPTADDIRKLNKRLQWQIDHQGRGLRYIPLDLPTAKLFVFVDGSFANNKDLSSQIGFIIIIGNETQQDAEFTLTGNIVTYSSTKSKRVTRSALASELYSMVQGADMAYAISTTLAMITNQLDIPQIPITLCTDSFSLYECLVKLGTTKEKRLMIDIMALRQSYERREIYEIRWINGQDNPADAMTKASPNNTLETFIDSNKVTIRVEGWVKREPKTTTDAPKQTTSVA
ncbi:Ribonuclease H-like protein [Metarhizium guizhouense ARSEF 977]|uniref:Ribonuclease H-like protein n=2 Tax=Metarhizium guizhouense (strain ARSEF 977) TaxID=1276136 RepID=A0A0B4GCY6_METGA|nr:Ribonuclease H-like protein [Metarhizium guizhouense ARSEF 977]KID83061.1 Ribonuclease H-like protein [Metarhizium guizhouense ARSEF 977]KID84780.1 Ribonuclease H-like protein [Metarhizium guizhouense ARSEF 977]